MKSKYLADGLKFGGFWNRNKRHERFNTVMRGGKSIGGSLFWRGH
jgi:hypothetical protein